MRSIQRELEVFSIFRSGEGTWVITLEVLRTSRIQRFLGVCYGESEFPKVSVYEVNMYH
jgi:hypothetical protein